VRGLPCRCYGYAEGRIHYVEIARP
jgi:hypothetical protein